MLYEMQASSPRFLSDLGEVTGRGKREGCSETDEIREPLP